MEHAYAPPFSSAKDPITLVACVAENILTQKMYAIDWRELQNRPADSYQLLDVRTLAEYKEGALPNAIHIPVDELRERLDELPEAKTIVLYCGVGLRGHVASRILLQNGYKEVFNLAGGFKTAHDLLEG